MNKYLELFKNKTEISLSFRDINDNEVLLICEALEKNTNLKKISLYKNNITDEGAKALAKNTTLEELDLGDNIITDEGTKALAKNITLGKLSLCWNNISDGGAKALVKNKTLKELNLWVDSISDDLLDQIKTNIQNNNKRQKLSILTTKVVENNNINIPDYYPKILLKY